MSPLREVVRVVTIDAGPGGGPTRSDSYLRFTLTCGHKQTRSTRGKAPLRMRCDECARNNAVDRGKA